MKKLFFFSSFYVAVMLIFSVTPVLAANTNVGFNDQASNSSSYSTEGFRGSRGSYSGSTPGSSPYRSGPQRPSSGITPTPRSGGGFGTGIAPRSGFGSFFGGMAAGAIAGSIFHSMFNPFGYGYGGFGGFGGTSLLGIVLDVVVIYIVIRIMRRLFSRNRMR